MLSFYRNYRYLTFDEPLDSIFRPSNTKWYIRTVSTDEEALNVVLNYPSNIGKSSKSCLRNIPTPRPRHTPSLKSSNSQASRMASSTSLSILK